MYNHTAIPVTDLHASQAFYEQLGLSKLREWSKPEQGLSTVVMQTAEGFVLELVWHPDNKNISFSLMPEAWHVGFEVTQLAELVARLEKTGTKLLRPITAGVSVKEFAFVADPDGHAVELVVAN